MKAPLVFVALLSCSDVSSASFVGTRLPDLCTDAYFLCGLTAGCRLDADHYVLGEFPGARRVVVVSDAQDTHWRVRLFLTTTGSPGTELLIQLHEPDCTTDATAGRVHLIDVDLIEEAGLDRTLVFEDLYLSQRGEHLLEVFSDAHAEYLLVVEQIGTADSGMSAE